MKYIRTQFQLTKVMLHDINYQDLSSSERLLLMIISSYANPAHQWQAWPSIDAIMRSSGLGKAGVHKVLKSLKDKGVLSALPGYSGRCTHYIIHIDKLADAKYATKAELDERKENKPVDKPVHQPIQSTHRYELDDDEYENTPF